MIQSLEITNFQSHAETELEFNPGVNVIIGSSDSGKTAIIRALRWVIWNRPSGDSIRSHWGGITSVKLETEDAIIITRSKDKDDKYISHITGEQDLEFKAFGTSVPEEISSLLNINEINLQQQLDSPFLLSETPGEVAKHFNKVAKLDKIDTANQNINGWIRTIKQDIDSGIQYQAKWCVELKKFDHLEKFEAEVEVLEEMDKRYVTALQRQTKLETFISNIKDVNADIKELKPLLELEEPINNILDLINKRAEEDLKEVKLDKLICQVKEIQVEIEQQKELITIEIPVNNLLKLYEDINIIESQRNLLFKVINNISNIKYNLENTKANHITLLNKFNNLFPDICPLCGQKSKKI
jgi:exonuclease SbcC